MKGYTENSVIIFRNIDEVFDITNKIEIWPDLFTEYEKTEVIEKKDNYIKFRLTTYANEEGKVKSWVSERKLDKKNYQVFAKRLEPLYPFSTMEIKWIYEPLPQNIGVNMVWIQEFEVDENSPFDVYNMESYLNKSSRTQMKAVKLAVEEILSK